MKTLKTTIILILTFSYKIILCWKPIPAPQSISYKAIETHIDEEESQKSQEVPILLQKVPINFYHDRIPIRQTPKVFIKSKPYFKPPKPIYTHGLSLPINNIKDDECTNRKVSFDQKFSDQYIQYKTVIPKLKEFTVCVWAKFTSHQNDHPLFSYQVDEQPREILFGVSNSVQPSYFSTAVAGHTLYRLYYPIQLNKWYHACQSWNGRTGEWQLWVNAERVGRGFHNRLVGHVIPANGMVISGQRPPNLNQNPLQPEAGAGGMLGDITMVQLYKVALTAGKAHKDHKHHHGHHYDNNQTRPSTQTPPVNQPTLPTNVFLQNGQLKKEYRLNYAGGQPRPIEDIFKNENNLDLNQQYLSYSPSFDQNYLSSSSISSYNSNLFNPANVQFIDNTNRQHSLFKRNEKEDNKIGTIVVPEHKRSKRNHRVTEIIHNKNATGEDNNQVKRAILLAKDGTLIDDGGSLIEQEHHPIDMAIFFDGLAGIGENQPILEEQKSSDEREPAEAEVKAVLQVCSPCSQEPFEKALVFGWSTVPKKLYSGALYQPSLLSCDLGR